MPDIYICYDIIVKSSQFLAKKHKKGVTYLQMLYILCIFIAVNNVIITTL